MPQHGTSLSLYLSVDLASRLSQQVLTLLDDRAHSNVFLGQLPQRCVVKQLRPRTGDVHVADFNRRLECAAADWRRASHIQNVQPFLGLWTYQGLPSIVSTYVGSRNLRDYFNATSLNIHIKFVILHKIAHALECMHYQNPPILHTNLKASNVIVNDRTGEVFLCNIGVHDTIWAPDQLDPTSIRWQAPEKIAGGPHSTACDIYSFGMTILEAMTLRDPFAEVHNVLQIPNMVLLQGQIPARPPGLSDQLWQLLRLCWSQEPQNRAPMEAVASQLRLLSHLSRPSPH